MRMIIMTKWKQNPIALGRYYHGASDEKTASDKLTSRKAFNETKVKQADEFNMFVAVIYGEANTCSEAAWRAVGHVIMNRVGKHEWSKFKTVTSIITQKYGFEAYGNNHFNIAYAYLNNKASDKAPNKLIDRMVSVLRTVYDGTDSDNTYGAVLYFSPKAQKALERKEPTWAKNNKLIEVKVDGLEVSDDFRFFKYKVNFKTGYVGKRVSLQGKRTAKN